MYGVLMLPPPYMEDIGGFWQGMVDMAGFGGDGAEGRWGWGSSLPWYRGGLGELRLVVYADYLQSQLLQPLQSSLLHNQVPGKSITRFHQNVFDAVLQAIVHAICKAFATNERVSTTDGWVTEFRHCLPFFLAGTRRAPLSLPRLAVLILTDVGGGRRAKVDYTLDRFAVRHRHAAREYSLAHGRAREQQAGGHNATRVYTPACRKAHKQQGEEHSAAKAYSLARGCTIAHGLHAMPCHTHAHKKDAQASTHTCRNLFVLTQEGMHTHTHTLMYALVHK